MSSVLRGSALVLTLALALAIPAPVAQAADSPTARPDRMAVDIVALTPSELEVYVEQTWVGERAKALRQSLDVYFGAADGTLTPSELDRIANATGSDMRNRTLDWVTLGDASVVVHAVDVSFGNATGAVADTRPLAMVHSLRVATGVAASAESVKTWVLNRGNGTMTFTPPEGWHIAEIAGIDGALDDAGILRAVVSENQTATFALVPGDPPPPTGPGVAPSPGGVAGEFVPGVGLPVVLALVAAAALARRALRKDR